MPSVTTGIRPDAPTIAVPPQGLPESPWGISWWQSQALISALVSAAFGVLAAVATLLRAIGWGDVAAAIEAGTAQVSQAELVSAWLTLAQAAGSLGSIVAGVLAARARVNGGRALSPINPSPLLRLALAMALLVPITACQGLTPTPGQALREARLAACGLYLARVERADLTRLSDADLARATGDLARWRPVCAGTAPTLSADPDAIRAAGDWLISITGER